MDYTYVDGPQAHPQRRREILSKYPQVTKLFKPYPLSALYILVLVATQWLLGFYFQQHSSAWWIILLCSYFVGAFINHALYVMIHECAHNLVFGNPTADKLMGILCDFALAIPSALGFRQYHLIHHTHLGQYDFDPDLVDKKEGQLVGNKRLNKTLWMTFFMISQGILRPLRLKNVKLWNKWTLLNLVAIVALDVALLIFVGPTMLIYLALSTFFALGLHPLGGRWIQEHYVTKEGQETYSYYGPLNKVTFNMGFHNEHHDFFMAPWINLPKIKAMAPEYYDGLKSYQSWSKVLFNFIWDKRLSPFSRIVHRRNDSVDFLKF